MTASWRTILMFILKRVVRRNGLAADYRNKTTQAHSSFNSITIYITFLRILIQVGITQSIPVFARALLSRICLALKVESSSWKCGSEGRCISHQLCLFFDLP